MSNSNKLNRDSVSFLVFSKLGYLGKIEAGKRADQVPGSPYLKDILKVIDG